MDKINYRFLNYKKHASFKTALDNDRIKDDSIVFIQDTQSIWARGKEYVCDGPYTTLINGGVLTLKKGNGTNIMSISLGNGNISITDGSDVIVKDTYASKSYVNDKVVGKQDKLQAGNGINIEGNKISSTLNVNVYEFITELGDASKLDPNKIYILENIIDGEYVYKQYRIKDNQWVQIGNVLPSVDLTPYMKTADADLAYQPKGDYVSDTDLLAYALSADVTTLSNTLINEYTPVAYLVENYATKSYVNSTFVKSTDLYTVEDGGEPVIDDPVLPGSGTNSGTGGSSVNIAVDYELNIISSNPIANRAVTVALSLKATKDELVNYATLTQLGNKADKSQLKGYVTNQQLTDSLSAKQDYLTAGKGIKIANNVISANLDVDTSIYVIVDSLPESDINENKIYLLKQEVNLSWTFGGTFPITFNETSVTDVVYIQYKYDTETQEWLRIGQTSPTINLSEYISRQEGNLLYAPKADYATAAQVEGLLEDIDNAYQQKGNYLVPNDLATYSTKQELALLSEVVEDDYVAKVQVYSEDAGVPGSDNPGWYPDGSHPYSELNRMVLLTEGEYNALVRNNLVKSNVYYFTYEGENSNNWAFGGTFPIILT